MLNCRRGIFEFIKGVSKAKGGFEWTVRWIEN